jgi:hypothetical protein
MTGNGRRLGGLSGRAGTPDRHTLERSRRWSVLGPFPFVPPRARRWLAPPVSAAAVRWPNGSPVAALNNNAD